MLGAIILSGGASQRMGSPKALLPYRGKTFLEHVLQITQHQKIAARRIVLGHDDQAIQAALKLAAEEVVVNAHWERGQLSSIQAGLRSLPVGTDGVLILPVDHPRVGRELIDELIEQFYSSRGLMVLPVYNGRRGHPVIFSSRLYEELLAAPLETGARAVVWAHSEEIVEVSTQEEGCVLNLNDPESLTGIST